MFIILTGKVAVTRQDGGDRPVGIATLGPGSVVGEMSLIDGERRYATCTTVEPTDIAVITRGDLDEILLKSPRLANKLLIRLLQLVVVRLRRTGDEVVSLTFVGA